MYGRAFTLEDEDEDGIISYEVTTISTGLTVVVLFLNAIYRWTVAI